MSPAAEPGADLAPGDSAKADLAKADLAKADSAGVPWVGRTLAAQPFAGDDGSAEPSLLAALAAYDGTAGHLIEVVRAWAPSRVMVPIVAVLGEGDDVRSAAEAGLGDKSADMALVTITGPDGRKVLPAFSSTATLAAWNPAARPVPVEAARAAQAAVLEECEAIGIDLAGPASCLLPRPVVWAVAQGREWLPPAEDPEVMAAVAAVTASVPGVLAHRCEADGSAEPSGLTVILGLPPGLDGDQVQQIAGRVSQLLATDDVVAERAGSLRLSLRTV